MSTEIRCAYMVIDIARCRRPVQRGYRSLLRGDHWLHVRTTTFVNDSSSFFYKSTYRALLSRPLLVRLHRIHVRIVQKRKTQELYSHRICDKNVLAESASPRITSSRRVVVVVRINAKRRKEEVKRTSQPVSNTNPDTRTCHWPQFWWRSQRKFFR